ncbi:hypothetical protein L2W58_08245 [Dethiosulfovibrio sp. F2B]|uniref:hypothetical protein n=1 Tax=Dethiosulfovibrio faecalis TaxID=2720018 RepID=UPI001F1BAF7F|nr:hypothetical protein [Dethiosulfovibrio faecalis]MCF4151792.1 hypothetical protein [Dethiosulfovibrio faecalis]
MGYEETVEGILDSYSKKKDKKWFCNCKCEDQWISVEEKNEGYELTPNDRPSQESDDPCFILILESPHRREFKTYDKKNKKLKTLKTPKPANGKTGRNIQDHFIDSMAIQMDGKKKCYIYLLNAIQYQCSLGLTQNQENKKIKLDIFNKTWGNEGMENFKERLKGVYGTIPDNRPTYIVNACTNLGKLKEDITTRASEVTEKKIFQRCHPSSGYFIVEARAYRQALNELRPAYD